jgi:glycosyltransferase involved in cell wall biosynthesis
MTRNLKKILILSIWEDLWSLGEGAGVADELEFIRYMTQQGIEIHFLVPKSKRRRTTADNPLVTYHTYPNIFKWFDSLPSFLNRFLWFALFPLVVMRKLERHTAGIRPDILLGFSHLSFYPLSRIGRKFGIPTVAKLFGVMYLDRTEFSKLKYLWMNYEQIIALRSPVDHYIIMNDGTRGEAAFIRLGIPGDKITFLPNGMHMDWADTSVDRDGVRRAMELPVGKILVVTLSRLIKSKRVELFLRAAAMMDPSLRGEAAFVVAGDGSQRRRLEREARKLGIADRVFFTGVIPYRDAVHFLKASDIFAATNELTNMSMPPCEAVLCGVPVVAFDVCGTSEVIRDGETGLLVTDGDVAAFARKLELLVRDESLRRRLGRGAAAFGGEYFVSWDERIEAELGVLERCARYGNSRARFR